MNKGLQIHFIEEAAAGFSSELLDTLHRKARSDNFLASMPQIIHVHGTRTSLVDVQGHTWPDELDRIRIEGECSFETMEAGIPQEFQGHLARTISKLKQDLFRMFYSRLDKITEATGNVFDGRQYKTKAEVLCDMIEKMELGFDGGRLDELQIHCAPEQAKEFEEMLHDPVVQLRLSVSIIKKYFSRYSL